MEVIKPDILSVEDATGEAIEALETVLNKIDTLLIDYWIMVGADNDLLNDSCNPSYYYCNLRNSILECIKGLIETSEEFTKMIEESSNEA